MDSTSKACRESHAKTKAADLQRIRNNQRRSRARRKDYIAELEEKVRSYESSGNQTFTDLKFQQLLKENEFLKRLLHSIGLGDEFLKAYTKASKVAQEISQPAPQLGDKGCCRNNGCFSSDNMQADSTPSATLGMLPPSPFLEADYRLDTELPTQSLFQFQQNSLETEDFTPWNFSFDFSNFTHNTSEAVQSQTQSYTSQVAIQSMTNAPIVEASENSMSPENTTLCSMAFSLITNNNRKCYNAAELDLRLRAGYRDCSATSGGCRIENKILFSVLAEIS